VLIFQAPLDLDTPTAHDYSPVVHQCLRFLGHRHEFGAVWRHQNNQVSFRPPLSSTIPFLASNRSAARLNPPIERVLEILTLIKYVLYFL